MADDELIIYIDKAYWPKSIVRGLAPELRTLGEKHGNLTIAALQAKGQIMVKGAPEHVEGVKEALRAIIEEHFPDAPIPEELGGPGEGYGEEGEWQEDASAEEQAEAEEEQVPEPAPAPVPKASPMPAHAKVAPAPAPAKAAPPSKVVLKPLPVAAKAAPNAPRGMLGRLFGAKSAAAAVPTPSAEPQKPVYGRKRPRPESAAPADLLWECIKDNSSFIRRPDRQILKRPFCADPANLVGLHAFKFSGVAASEALNVRPTKRGIKEGIELVQSHPKAECQRQPKKLTVTCGLSKCPKQGLQRLDCEIDAKFYRRGMHGLARLKYLKVQQSFKKKKRIQKSRRSE